VGELGLYLGEEGAGGEMIGRGTGEMQERKGERGANSWQTDLHITRRVKVGGCSKRYAIGAPPC
jgi:hypothetical protein